MGRRDPDPRPAVEVLGADGAIETSQKVVVGGRSPDGKDRRRVGLLVLAVLGLLVVGLALGGGGGSGEGGEQASPDPPAAADTTTTDRPRPAPPSPRRSTTTTTTTFAPTGPVFGEPMEGSLLVFANRSWTLVDLATGARQAVRLPTDSPYGGIPVEGGIVLSGISAEGPGATFYPLGDAEPEGRFLQEGGPLYPSSRGDAVWISSSFAPGPSDGVIVRLVDLTGRVLRSIEVRGTEVRGASDQGLLVSRGGRVFLVDESGSRAVATGDLLAATPDRLLLTTCDDRASCDVVHLDLATGAQRVVGAALGWHYGYSVSAGPGGRLALVGYGELNPEVQVLGGDGSLAGRLEMPALGAEPVWLPGDLGLLVVDERQMRRIPLSTGPLEVVDIEALAGLPVELAYLIPG